VKIEGVDHVDVAVRDLEGAVQTWTEVLGLKVVNRYRDEAGEKINVAQLQAGDTILELVESTDPEGPVARFIRDRGEGFLLVSLKVDSVDEAIRELKARGAPVLDERPRRIGNSLFTFVHPRALNGVLVELITHEG